MKWFHWLGLMIVGAAFVFLATLAVHNANAAPLTSGISGMVINPRGPGGPPVVVEQEEEAGPRWKLVVTLEGPPGKEQLTYGDKEHGIHWYKTKDECEKAKKVDPKLAQGLKLLAQQVKASKMPISVTVECKTDDSV